MSRGRSVDWRAVSLLRRALGAAALGALTGCATTAASGGAAPGDQAPSPPTVTESTLPPDVTPDLAPATTDPIVAKVQQLLGGQASISREVGDELQRPDVTDDRVFILGDSITEAGGPDSYDTIREALRPLGWRATVDAVKGRTTSEGLRELKRRRSSVHDVVIVLVGHNDPVDPVAYREKLDAMVKELAGVARVIFLTNYEFEPGRDRMNDQLRAVDALTDNVEVVDWNAVVDHTPGAIGPDGLHLTEEGARALAATMAVTLGVAPDGAIDGEPPATGS
jgi:lysophospholipase L1-like esterase